MVLAGGPFAAPEEGPVPFRRDRVPLDVETMTGLSQQLTQLSRTLGDGQPADRRAVAKTLALALALDPANREARDLIAERLDGKAPSVGPDDQSEKARAALWQLLPWLESEEAGKDAQALGTCLAEVAAAVDPLHPSASERKENGRVWKRWIPELAAYQEKAVEPSLPPAGTESTPASAGPVLARREASVGTPLWAHEKPEEPAALQLVTVSMRASIEKDENPQPFQFQFQGSEPTEALRKANESVTAALKAMGDTLPAGGKVSLRCGKTDYSFRQNGDSVTAAAAVLLDAAVSGREPDATVLGVVDASGLLKLPSRAWDRLRALSSGPGGRLIVPREAEPMLTSILALEDAAFFMKYEVILAGNVKELVERSAKTAEGPLAEVSSRFNEIRIKQGTMNLGQYAANRFVRQRFAEIYQLYPDHVSARLLDVQGAGKRPIWLPRPILASEIRKAIEPIGPFAKKTSVYEVEVDQIDKIHDACRVKLDALERYADMRDRELHAKSKDLLNALRTTSKARRSRDELYGYDRFQTSMQALKAAYDSYRRELASVAADEDVRDLEAEK